jgi:hypothetical protein
MQMDGQLGNMYTHVRTGCPVVWFDVWSTTGYRKSIGCILTDVNIRRPSLELGPYSSAKSQHEVDDSLDLALIEAISDQGGLVNICIHSPAIFDHLCRESS